MPGIFPFRNRAANTKNSRTGFHGIPCHASADILAGNLAGSRSPVFICYPFLKLGEQNIQNGIIMSPAASPIFRLVLFMACLALFGSIVGGAQYYLIELPEQEALSENPPANWDLQEKCDSCKFNCKYVEGKKYWECLARCELIC